jgi:ATP-dependent exoDNAse (exonuclease V) alpha subunit
MIFAVTLPSSFNLTMMFSRDIEPIRIWNGSRSRKHAVQIIADERARGARGGTGRGKFEEIGKGKSWRPAASGVAVNEEQAAAVEHILRSRDLVTAVRGVAGSGKTTMLDQAARAIADLSGLDVMALAPSASATEVLRKQGFKRAATVQKLLADPEVQRLATGKILLVDEAGFLSVHEMRQLVSFGAGNNCRVILSGDSRQHHSVERGDALRILEKTGRPRQLSAY